MTEKREVITARTAGFCFGVRRAVEQVYEQIGQGDAPIYTYGPIIHNAEVVRDLEEKGVSVLAEEHLQELNGGTVIIRSHGVSRQIQQALERTGAQVVDATCPFVKKIHRIVEEKGKEGYNILIAGNPRHPEVEGIIGWCSTPVQVVETPEQIDELPEDFLKKVCFVAQTTFNYKKFNIMVAKLEKTMYDILVFKSICSATHERQVEAKQIASTVDCMLVVGDRHSSNTQKLYEICMQECGNTHLLQTKEELSADWFRDAARVGITAGASTPHKIIEEVQTYVRYEF